MFRFPTKCTSIYDVESDTRKWKSKVCTRILLFFAYILIAHVFFVFECEYTHLSFERPMNLCTVLHGVRTQRNENKRNWASKDKHQPLTAIYRCWFGWMFFDHPHIVVIDRLLCIQLLYCVALPIIFLFHKII